MAKPAIFTIDDDPPVLRAVERDLRKRYADRYRILRAESGSAALEMVRELKQRNDPVALFLADHRMPRMTGVEFLAAASKMFPDAQRVLLTAYADTDAAIRAINEVKLHHYLLKPWDPPERELYPVLDDLLDDWQATFRPPFEGVRILGTRWSPHSYKLRDLLVRNHIPYQWMDAEAANRDEEIRQLTTSLGEKTPKLPVVFFRDGTTLSDPSLTELAGRVGLRTRSETDFYDLVIVGGGPAGLAAAVYGASEGLRTALLEREAPGGQASSSSRIENYLGFPSGLTGGELARRAVVQARRFGAELLTLNARSLTTEGSIRILRTLDGFKMACHAVLLATGIQWRRLDVPGMDRLQGAGVYYGGGLTEAVSCSDEQIYIVGGANSAGQAAMYFSRYASRVIMLVRGKSLAASMSHYLIDQIASTPNIEVRYGACVAGVDGHERLEAIDIRCEETGMTERAPASTMFIFIGAEPKTDWLEGTVQRDRRGFILTGPDIPRDGKRPKGWTLDRQPFLLESSLPGVFAAGDARFGSIKRVASGVGEGAMAVALVHQYLAKV